MCSLIPNFKEISEAYKYISPIATPCIAAGGALIPTYYGFLSKSAKQLGSALPAFNTKVIVSGVKDSPIIGITVGVQILVQNALKKVIEGSSPKAHSTESMASIFGSAVTVGLVSAPLLLIFNGKLSGLTTKESLRSPLAVLAMTVRETSFLASLQITEPLSKKLKESYGDTSATKYSSACISGIVCSIIGHPADTVVTFIQNQRKIVKISQFGGGMMMRAVTLGSFNICYTFITNALNEK